MARKKVRRKPLQEASLNLAAMLDMAFQLLMFFVLTFSPAPIESQVQMMMPLASSAIGVGAAAEKPTANDSGSSSQTAGRLTVTLLAAADGRIRDMAVGNTVVADLGSLQKELLGALTKAGSAGCQIVLQVDANLHYQDLLDVIEQCTKSEANASSKIQQMTFVELRDKSLRR